MTTGLDAEVGVVGVGSIGALGLWHLAGRGTRVVAFEQFTPGHDRGAAGGESRVFRLAYHEGAQYVPLLVEARAQWERLGRDLGVGVFDPCGYLEIGPHGSEGIAATLATVDVHGLAHEVLDADAAAARFPQHRLAPDDVAVLDPAGGVLRPEYAVAGATRYAETRGVTVQRRARVDRIEPDCTGVVVRAGTKAWKVGSLILSVGAWTGHLLSDLEPVVRPTRLALTWFPALDPASFAPESFPAFGRTLEGTFIYGVPSLDGRTVKVATTSIDDALRVDPDHLDRALPDQVVERICDLVHRYFPGLIPDPVRASAYVDGYSPDGHGLVGLHPQHRNVVLVTGLSGHGFKLAPVLAQAACDLALEGRTDTPIAFLDPGRVLGLVTP